MTTEFNVSWRRYLLPPLHPEGPMFVAIFAVIGLLLWWAWAPLGIVGALLTVWCFYFFRDPDRSTPIREGLIITPASGIVSLISHVPPPRQLDMGEEPRWRVSVFMSVFDCHVNRVPAGGIVKKIVYVPGKFVNASLDKASEDNERNLVRLEMHDGRDIAFVQIAGLVARRIRCDAREGQKFRTGERYGLIRFGSRLDIYLPPGVEPLVTLGQSCVSGETVIADALSDEKRREGEAR
ncbi:phosphatidylserine decarboxylase [Caenispirillum bisanense]|uniref:phosphatidylserine decarboxylase n=1 Tax=Caenispirillum bisanense TaxID=414052 RepID=UPI0031D370B3